MDFTKIQSLLFDYRFEILAILLTSLIFGGGIAPSGIFEDVVLPITIFLLAIIAIITARNQQKPIRFLFIGFGFLALLSLVVRWFNHPQGQVRIVSLIIFALFLATLSFEVFRQMLREKKITQSIIFAAFDCYLLLGVLGAMLFTFMVTLDPDSFSNVSVDMHVFDKMNYFSFITLTSIGYGDITPVSVFAEKVTAFYGLIGHFYSVVIVGIIVGKYVATRNHFEDGQGEASTF